MRQRWRRGVVAAGFASWVMLAAAPAWAANDARSGMIFGVAVLIEIITCLGQVVMTIMRISESGEGLRRAHRAFAWANTVVGGALTLYMLLVERVGSNPSRLAVVAFFGGGVFFFGIAGLRASKPAEG